MSRQMVAKGKINVYVARVNNFGRRLDRARKNLWKRYEQGKITIDELDQISDEIAKANHNAYRITLGK